MRVLLKELNKGLRGRYARIHRFEQVTKCFDIGRDRNVPRFQTIRKGDG